MKISTFLLMVIISFFQINLLYSQNTNMTGTGKPFIEIGVNSSYNYALFDLSGSGDLKGFWSFQDYGMGSGIGTWTDVKLGVLSTRMLILKVHMMVGYSHFAKSDGKAYNIGSIDMGWPYKTVPSSSTFVPRDTTGISSLRINMPFLGFGLECGLYTDRESKSSFNFGVDVIGTLITGRAYETIINAKESFVTINPSFRIGLGLNASYSYRFENWVGFNVGTKFTMPNLLGKSSEMTDQAGYLSLLDDSNSALNPLLNTKRIMGYLQLYAGMSFYLGRL
jgi:hypothetical protein